MRKQLTCLKVEAVFSVYKSNTGNVPEYIIRHNLGHNVILSVLINIRLYLTNQKFPIRKRSLGVFSSSGLSAQFKFALIRSLSPSPTLTPSPYMFLWLKVISGFIYTSFPLFSPPLLQLDFWDFLLWPVEKEPFAGTASVSPLEWTHGNQTWLDRDTCSVDRRQDYSFTHLWEKYCWRFINFKWTLADTSKELHNHHIIEFRTIREAQLKLDPARPPTGRTPPPSSLWS